MTRIYTDGSASILDHSGGWAIHVVYSDGRQENRSGAFAGVTNNQMELFAVIEAFLYIVETNLNPTKVTVFSDSQYVVKGLTEWIPGWKAKNWKNVKNVGIWKQLDQLYSALPVALEWVRGHDGNPGNETVDKLASLARKSAL